MHHILVDILDQGYRMMAQLLNAIDTFSAGVYLTILPLIPFDTPFHASSRDKSGRLTVSYGREATWIRICTIQESGPAYSVAYIFSRWHIYSLCGLR